MFQFRRQPGLPASELLIALAVACGLGCGENVLVTSWELSLRASDAGAEAEAEDAGFENLQARKAQQARANLRKEAKKEEAEKDNHGEKSSR